MRLHIVRHADPDYANNTITADGHLEAQALAKRIKKYGVDKIYCSPLQRSIDTMQYTKNSTEVEPIFLDFLKEVQWENFISGNYKCPFDLPAELLINDNNLPSQYNWKDNSYFDGDSIEKDLEGRIKALNDLLLSLGYKREENHYVELKESSENVYLFCHAGIGGAIIAYLLNIPLNLFWCDFWLAPSSVTTILFSKRNGEKVFPRCVHLNDVSHLYSENLPIKPRGFKGNFQ